MNDTIEAPAANAVIGHNKAPDPGVQLIELTLRATDKIENSAADYLKREHEDLMRRLKEIRATIAAGIPARITEKADAEKLSDVRFAIKKWITAAKLARTQEKKPWDSIGKIFYAFFTRPIEELEEADADKIAPVLNDWQERETERARREAAAEEARLRAEAEAKEKAAREAEDRRLAAERAEREAAERAAEAERKKKAEIEAAARAKAEKEEQERQAAEAAKRAEVAKKEREEQDRLAREAKARREADEAASAEARAEEEAANQRAADAKKREEEADAQRRINEEAARKAQDEEHAAKQRSAAAKAEQTQAERDQVGARKEQRTAGRDERIASTEAERADRRADKFEDKATGSAADLSRVRGEAGSVSSLRTFKNFRSLDRKTLDLEALRSHIPLSAYETAVRSFIDAGGTELRGVEIFDDTGTTTR